jgi:hypothetical protein
MAICSYYKLHATASFARFEAQVQSRGVTILAPIRMDIAQPIEQFTLDTRRMLTGEFHRTRGPSERDAPFESAEIVEEPRATGKRRLPRTDHLEHPEQGLATVFLDYFEAL